MKRMIGVLVCAAFLLCGGGFALAADQEPIVIGFNLEMTGQVAAYGQAAWEVPTSSRIS